MRFVTVRELNTKPKEVWSEVRKDEVVVTSNGKPIALLSAVTEETLDKTRRALRRARALMAMEEMQEKSLASGVDKITDSEIEAEIQAVRKNRRQ